MAIKTRSKKMPAAQAAKISAAMTLYWRKRKKAEAAQKRSGRR